MTKLPAAPPPLEALIGTSRATIPDLLDARARRSPRHPFVVQGESIWSYAGALEEAEHFSGWALRRGVASDSTRRIASFLPNRPEAMWAWFGSLLAGATYVPLNRAHRGMVLLDMLMRSRAEVLVTDREGLDLLPSLDCTALDTVLVVDGERSDRLDRIRIASWQEVRDAPAVRGPSRAPSDPAELVYTSGTTGRSKAVLVPHNYLCRGAGWVAWSLSIGEDDVIHGWLPLYHIGGQVDMVLALLVGGGTVALQPTFSRSRFWEQVEASGATIFIGFSNVIEILWDLPAREDEAGTTLRAGIMGGIPPKLHRPFEERFGVNLFDVYGMTEAEPLALPWPGSRPPVDSVGRPSPDFEIAILGADDEPVAPGQSGQIAFRPRTADVMLTTYEDDDAAFVDATRNLWFHTGDLGRMDENGHVYFLDRFKHAIRRRGENISSFELERIIIQHESVRECCAVGVPSPVGEQDIKIVVVPDSGVEIDPQELRAWCFERMAHFMVPRYIELRDRLPRGPTGKVQKEGLGSVSAEVYDAEAVPTT